MSLRALTEFIQRQTEAAEIQSIESGRGLWLPPDAGAEVGEMMSARTPAELTASVVELRNLMPGGDLFHNAVLALLCGSLVENGADAGGAIDATLELLVRQLDAFAERPDAEVLAASRLSFPAAMTMLSRSRETRKRWRERPDVMERLDELEDNDFVPFFLREIFTLHDDFEILLLDPKNRRAFRFRLIAVRDRLYHAYALLQDALLRHAGPGYLDAEPVDPDAVNYARNTGLDYSDPGAWERIRDHQRFNFAYPGGLFMPGSASPLELPQLDGIPFLVVEPKLTHFGWQPSNMYPVLHEALRASAELIEELDPAAAEGLLARCGLA
ncbi:hypothetical protein JK358_11880 [Nocardia sp. 2]|uniref:Uncharacterized protein n=1 Tax=Nocardia acididurans TaxID=2802282 RepID=A0ABS1M351_9NOCA|nr:hypothetical protein [Nocardia acididurans]MBL1075092.1 hypothetical protein [Nocardia acididurans]